MKKGFTLVEVLAVIVILAAIMLITIPVVLNTISESRASSAVVSASKYLDALKLSISNKLLDNITIKDGRYNILENGNVCIGIVENDVCSEELEISSEGKKPDSGTITITEGEIGAVRINFGKRTIVRNSKGYLVNTDSLVCVGVVEDSKTTGNIPTGEFNIGDEYICEVKDEVKYHFFVVESDKNSVNLILDRNINSDGTLMQKQAASPSNPYSAVAWMLLDDYKIAANDTSLTKAFTTYGPVTAMNFVTEATESWNNIPNMDETYEDETISITTGVSGSDSYGTYEITGKARLPKYSEVFGENKCGSAENSCPLWLVNYMAYYSSITGDGVVNIPKGSNEIYGYWLMSSASDQTYARYGWYVSYKGFVGNANIEQSATRGIRPVIKVSKEIISQ